MFKLQHTGYPVSGRPIDESEWKDYSKHKTFSAAYKRYLKATTHLSSGSWDDHYRFIDEHGNVMLWHNVLTKAYHTK